MNDGVRSEVCASLLMMPSAVLFPTKLTGRALQNNLIDIGFQLAVLFSDRNVMGSDSSPVSPMLRKSDCIGIK